MKTTFLAILLSISTALSASAQTKFKILSYNVLKGLQQDSLNINRYISWVNKLDPDMVAYQEMNGFTQKSLEDLSHRYRHPYALQSKLEGFPVALSSKTPLVDFRKVTENMWHSYIYAKVKGLNVFVIHFSPFSYKKRQEEVTNIIAQAKALPANEPILIMGDFNSLDAADSAQYDATVVKPMLAAEKKEAHIRNLNNGQVDYTVLKALKDAGFKDSFWLSNKTFKHSVPTSKDGNGQIGKNTEKKGKRIDYLWVNDAASRLVTKSDIIHDEDTHILSDHYPVYVELTLSR